MVKYTITFTPEDWRGYNPRQRRERVFTAFTPEDWRGYNPRQRGKGTVVFQNCLAVRDIFGLYYKR